MKEYYKAREEIYELLKKELVGPVEENETIEDELPIKTYSLGILYPQGVSEYCNENPEALEEKDDDNAEEDESVKLENTARQASIGISCNIKNNTNKLKIKVNYSQYIKEEKQIWRRFPKEWQKEVDIKNDTRIKIDNGLEIRITTYKVFTDETKTATISLINTNIAEKEEELSSICNKSFLQVRLEISSVDETNIFIEKQINLNRLDDHEFENLKLLYRNKTNLAIGNGTAVMWERKGKETNRIWTEVLPEYTANQMIPLTTETGKYLELHFLANDDKENIYKELNKLPEAYDKWLQEQEKDQSLSERKEIY